MSKIFIYTLTEEGSEEVRYVGQTYNLDARLYGHLNGKMADGNPKVQWINEVLSRGGKIKINQIDECSHKESVDFEKYWMEHFREKGHRLTNTGNAMPSKVQSEKEPVVIERRSIIDEDKIVDILGNHTEILTTLVGKDDSGRSLFGILFGLSSTVFDLMQITKKKRLML